MLYVRLSKALYVILKTALLFYKRLRFDLEEMGFVVNPYDPCVANMMANGAQINVCWYIDNIKISQRDEEVVSAFTIQIEETYGPKTTISRGKVHDYLSMQLDFGTCPGSMIISMIKYLQNILDEWPEVLGGTKAYFNTSLPALTPHFQIGREVLIP